MWGPSMQRQLCTLLAVIMTNFLAASAHAHPFSGGNVEALIPVEAVAPESPPIEGRVWNGGIVWDWPIIATQPAQFVRTISVDEADDDLPGGTAVLTLLGPIEAGSNGAPSLDVASERLAWCVLRVRTPTMPCFQDIDSDGVLETVRIAHIPESEIRTRGRARNRSMLALEALGIDHVGPARSIHPRTFHVPASDENLTLRIGYASCGGGDPETVRYATLIQLVENGRARGSTPTTACTNIAQSLGPAEQGGEILDIGRFHVRVYRDGGARKAELIEAIPAGTLLGRLKFDRPIFDAIEAPSTAQELADRIGPRPFLYFATKPSLATGSISPGGLILEGEVAHGITGRLSEVRTAGWFNTQGSLPAGTPVYGIPMSNSSDNTEIVWCAPIRKDNGEWRARCMPRGPTGYVSLNNLEPAFAISLLIYQTGGGGPTSATAPVVDRQDVDFGEPLVMSLRFESWTSERAIVEFDIGPGGASGGGAERRFRRASDGSVTLLFGRSALRLAPSAEDPNDAELTISAAPQAGDMALIAQASSQN